MFDVAYYREDLNWKNDECFTGKGCESSKLTRRESHRLKEPKRKCNMLRKGPN